MKKQAFITRNNIESSKEYVQWLQDIKQRIRQAQTKAKLSVNEEMLQLYWSIGRDMQSMRIEERWGEGIVRQFAIDMRNEFPHISGFSETNIKYMRRWYIFYNESLTIGHQAGDQLEMPSLFGHIPWRHHVEIFTKCHTSDEAFFYISKTIENNWSRRTLEDNIASNLYQNQGSAITNFEERLPVTDGALIQDILKDPYNFDFLTMKEGYDEKELESALVDNITRFLLELGKGFAYVGRQMELRMDEGQSIHRTSNLQVCRQDNC